MIDWSLERLYWIIQGGAEDVIRVLIRGRQEGQGDLMMEAEVAVMWPGTKASQERQAMDSPLGPPEGTSSADTLMLAFWTCDFQNRKEISLCCFKLLNVWWFFNSRTRILIRCTSVNTLLIKLSSVKASSVFSVSCQGLSHTTTDMCQQRCRLFYLSLITHVAGGECGT